MKWRLFIPVLCGLSLLLACEEVIELPLKDPDARLVIEGQVSSLGNTQEVRVSEVLPFDAEQRSKAVEGARVFLNENGGDWHRLTETERGRYQLDGFQGRTGRRYGLRVEVEGKLYHAYSTMPGEVRIDSTGISVNTFDNARQTPLVVFQDPPGVKNYYFFDIIVNEKVLPSLFLYNDKFNDGKSVYQNLDDFDLDLQSGDRVSIELRNIDEASFNFWDGVRSQGGFSASPGNPPSNISDGALGNFSAYGANRVFFVVQ
jgi:hypothetical protein